MKMDYKIKDIPKLEKVNSLSEHVFQIDENELYQINSSPMYKPKKKYV